MLLKVLLNKNLSFKNRLKNFIEYYRFRRGARIQWRNRHKIVFNLHSDLKKPGKRKDERDHKLYWKPFNRNIDTSTFRACTNISGIALYKYIPEEIFRADIEPTLNQTPSVQYLTYKSFYGHWFPDNIFPHDYFHNIDGEWLDHNLNPISFSDVKSIASKLDYPVVVKPNRDSYGGKNIFFPQGSNELLTLIENKRDLLVQEKIKQDTFFNKFNQFGLNTVRVNIYRSVTDNRLHIINAVLRMGVGGSLDNETAGGIVTMIRSDGYLNGFAVDKFGGKYFKHPDTGYTFDQKIPDYDGLVSTSLKVASKVLYARLVCLDLCYDSHGNWRMIEINIFGATIRFAQYHGTLFFGEFTDEVYNYCIQNHWALK